MTKPVQIDKKNSWKLFDEIAGTYDLANHFLSFGIDILWRKKLMSLIPKRMKDDESYKILDIATGTGDVALTLAPREDIGDIRGIDLSQEMIDIGNQKAKDQGKDHKVRLEIGDGVTIPKPDNSIDVITLSFGVRNFPDIEESMRNMNRVLKKGGKVLIMEFGLPKNFFVRNFYLFYFRVVLPFLGKLISRHPFAYSYLNRTVEQFPYGQEFVELMEKNGLQNCKAHSLTFGIAYIYEGYKGEV